MTEKQTLEKYLKEILNCHDDERLYREFAIYQNWPIFMNANIENVVSDLCQTGIFSLNSRKEKRGQKIITLDYVPGTVIIDGVDYVVPFYTKGNSEERDKQLKNHSITFLLDHQQLKRIPNLNQTKAIARVIVEIGDYIIRKNIPACFPLWGYKEGIKPVYHNIK